MMVNLKHLFVFACLVVVRWYRFLYDGGYTRISRGGYVLVPRPPLLCN